MKTRLTKEEFDYAVSAPFIPERLRNELINGVQNRVQNRGRMERMVVEVTEDSADIIRSLCEDQLNLVGFDIDYSLNSQGKILDSLIDKFFTD
ncbi:MAG: hypothetical protein OEY77_12395 [Nitrospira sp.]|nr:hypothetical protein [Nitrospira sp.]